MWMIKVSVITALICQTLSAPSGCLDLCNQIGGLNTKTSDSSAYEAHSANFKQQQEALLRDLHASLTSKLGSELHTSKLNIDSNRPGNWTEHKDYKTSDGAGQVHEEQGQLVSGQSQVRYYKKNYSSSYSSGVGDSSLNSRLSTDLNSQSNFRNDQRADSSLHRSHLANDLNSQSHYRQSSIDDHRVVHSSGQSARLEDFGEQVETNDQRTVDVNANSNNWSRHNSYNTDGGRGKVYEEEGQYHQGPVKVRYFKKNYTSSYSSGPIPSDALHDLESYNRHVQSRLHELNTDSRGLYDRDYNQHGVYSEDVNPTSRIREEHSNREQHRVRIQDGYTPVVQTVYTPQSQVYSSESHQKLQQQSYVPVSQVTSETQYKESHQHQHNENIVRVPIRRTNEYSSYDNGYNSHQQLYNPLPTDQILIENNLHNALYSRPTLNEKYIQPVGGHRVEEHWSTSEHRSHQTFPQQTAINNAQINSQLVENLNHQNRHNSNQYVSGGSYHQSYESHSGHQHTADCDPPGHESRYNRRYRRDTAQHVENYNHQDRHSSNQHISGGGYYQDRHSSEQYVPGRGYHQDRHSSEQYVPGGGYYQDRHSSEQYVPGGSYHQSYESHGDHQHTADSDPPGHESRYNRRYRRDATQQFEDLNQQTEDLHQQFEDLHQDFSQQTQDLHQELAGSNQQTLSSQHGDQQNLDYRNQRNRGQNTHYGGGFNQQSQTTGYSQQEQNGHSTLDYQHYHQSTDLSQQSQEGLDYSQQQTSRYDFGSQQRRHGYDQQTETGHVYDRQSQTSGRFNQHSRGSNYDQQQNVEGISAQISQNYNHQVDNLNQQTENLNREYSQQTNRYNFDQQQSRIHQNQQTADLSQQTESLNQHRFDGYTQQQTNRYNFDQQQSQNHQSQQTADLSQQTENLNQHRFDDYTQQQTNRYNFDQQQSQIHQNQQNADLSQQTADLSQQTENLNQHRFDDYTQQQTNRYNFDQQQNQIHLNQQTADLSQQTENLNQHQFDDYTQQQTNRYNFGQQHVQKPGSIPYEQQLQSHRPYGGYASETEDLNQQNTLTHGFQQDQSSGHFNVDQSENLNVGGVVNGHQGPNPHGTEMRPAPKPIRRLHTHGETELSNQDDINQRPNIPIGVKGGRGGFSQQRLPQSTGHLDDNSQGVGVLSLEDQISQQSGVEWHQQHQLSDLTSENYQGRTSYPTANSGIGSSSVSEVNRDTWQAHGSNPDEVVSANHAFNLDTIPETTTPGFNEYDTTPKPGFWKKVGKKITETYEKAKEKINKAISG